MTKSKFVPVPAEQKYGKCIGRYHDCPYQLECGITENCYNYTTMLDELPSIGDAMDTLSNLNLPVR